MNKTLKAQYNIFSNQILNRLLFKYYFFSKRNEKCTLKRALDYEHHYSACYFANKLKALTDLRPSSPWVLLLHVQVKKQTDLKNIWKKNIIESVKNITLHLTGYVYLFNLCKYTKQIQCVGWQNISLKAPRR
jgi:hypothetical protein